MKAINMKAVFKHYAFIGNSLNSIFKKFVITKKIK